MTSATSTAFGRKKGENVSDMLFMVDYPRKTIFAESAPIEVEYDYDRFASCPKCGRRVSGAHWMRPREVVLTSRKTPDFLYSYNYSVPFLLSQKALEIIRTAGLTGIRCAEEIEHIRFQRRSKTETPIPIYYHIELERSRITLDHKNSVIKYGTCRDNNTCPLCRQVPSTYDFTRKLAFHMEAYEGYDIFQIYELGNQVFLSRRFVELCEEKGLTNLHCTVASQHGRWAAEYFLDGNEDA